MEKIEKTNIDTFRGAVLALVREEYLLTRIELCNIILRTLAMNNKSIVNLSKQLDIEYKHLYDLIHTKDMKISDLVRIGSALNLGVNISFGASKVSDTGALDVLKDKIRKTEELVLDKDVSFANTKGQ